MEHKPGYEKTAYAPAVDPDFAEQVASIPGGEHLFRCIQCGTCSGMCPLSPYMDYMPRQIIAMIRAGLRGKVLGSHTTWLCASCYACTVACPRRIPMTDIMYAVKRLAIREGMHPKRFPTPVLAQEFFKEIEAKGRSLESRLLTRMLLRTHPPDMLRLMPLGWHLFRTGRMPLLGKPIARRAELHRMLEALEGEHLVSGRAVPPAARKEIP